MIRARMLDERIVRKNGSFETVRRWYEGWTFVPPRPGWTVRRINGVRGRETEVTFDRIVPIGRYEVNDDTD